VDAQAVQRAGPDLGDVAVPRELGGRRQIEAPDLAARIGGVVQANLDPRRDPRVHGEVRAPPIEGGATRERLTGPDAHGLGDSAPAGSEGGGHALGVFNDEATENKGRPHGSTASNPFPALASSSNNSASNAGAVGGLFAQLAIYSSLFQSNTATGNGANSNDPSRCSFINDDQNEIGSGGNGGAIDQDGGNATNVILCGDTVINNAAGSGAFGGGVFMPSNDFTGTMAAPDSNITGNTGGSWTQVKEGSVTNLGTAFGVNAKSATVQSSTLQGR
jgi:hypothetical protein